MTKLSNRTAGARGGFSCKVFPRPLPGHGVNEINTSDWPSPCHYNCLPSDNEQGPGWGLSLGEGTAASQLAPRTIVVAAIKVSGKTKQTGSTL